MSFDERDRNMMKNPNNWPMWPLLPLKNHRDCEPGQLPRIGVLVAPHAGDVRFLPDKNVQDVTTDDLAGVPQADVDELLDDGWVVD